MVVGVEEFHEPSFTGREKGESAIEQVQPASQIDLIFELGEFCNEPLINGIDVLERVTAPPVIADSIVDDFHQESTRVRYMAKPAESCHRVQRNFLFQIFIANGSAGSFRYDVNHRSDIGKI